MNCWNCVYWYYINTYKESVRNFDTNSDLSYGRCFNKNSNKYNLITDEIDDGCDKGSDTLKDNNKEDTN